MVANSLKCGCLVSAFTWHQGCEIRGPSPLAALYIFFIRLHSFQIYIRRTYLGRCIICSIMESSSLEIGCKQSKIYLVRRNWRDVVQGGQLPVKCRQLCGIEEHLQDRGPRVALARSLINQNHKRKEKI